MRLGKSVLNPESQCRTIRCTVIFFAYISPYRHQDPWFHSHERASLAPTDQLVRDETTTRRHLHPLSTHWTKRVTGLSQRRRIRIKPGNQSHRGGRSLQFTWFYRMMSKPYSSASPSNLESTRAACVSLGESPGSIHTTKWYKLTDGWTIEEDFLEERIF